MKDVNRNAIIVRDYSAFSVQKLYYQKRRLQVHWLCDWYFIEPIDDVIYWQFSYSVLLLDGAEINLKILPQKHNSIK